jgi:hypothetical protein
MVTLKRIEIGAAFRVGLVLSGLTALVFGLIGFGLQALFLNSLFSISTLSFNGGSIAPSDLNMVGGMSLAFLCCAYLAGVVMSAIFGGIGFAVVAALYNLTANWVGGLQFQLEDPSNPFDDLDKPKRS